MARPARTQAEYDAQDDSSPRARERLNEEYEMLCVWAGRCPRCARDTRIFNTDTERLARADPAFCNPCWNLLNPKD